MWRTRKTTESSGRSIKLTIDDGKNLLPFSGVLRLLSHDEDFRSFYIRQFNDVPFEAYRWETPPVVRSNFDREFECVILDSPGLGSNPDRKPFAQHFQSSDGKSVVVFPNLGNDAVMIVPCPITSDTTYGHLGAFHRNAPDCQKHLLWQYVGDTMIDRVSDVPIWLNTAGAGVSWLHVRLDSRPKYYHYSPYKTPPRFQKSVRLTRE
jgi:hypothetical protein